LESNIEQQTSKINCEELDPFPLSGVGIKHHAVFGFSVLRRRLWIQHLKWIPTPHGARKNALGIFFPDRRWRRGWPRFPPGSCRKRFRRFPLRLRRLRKNQAREGDKNSERYEPVHHYFSG
jgi:hypothetical protein